MDRLEELKRALEAAYADGRQDEVMSLARQIDSIERAEGLIGIPTVEGEELIPREEKAEEAPPRPAESFYPEGYSVGDALLYLRNAGIPNEAIAAVETLLGLGSAFAAGVVGMPAAAATEALYQASQGEFGSVEGARRASKAVEESAGRAMEQLTYTPRTGMGQRMVGQVADILEPLAQLPPVLQGALPAGAAATLPQRARMAQAALPERPRAAPEAGPAQPDAQAPLEQRARTPARKIPGDGRRPAEAVDMAEEALQAGPDSVGAARAPVEAVRRATAEQLPVPLTGEAGLTKGQATRSFEQTEFEQKAARMGTLGVPIRERMANQNKAIVDNFEVLIDQKRKTPIDIPDLGFEVTKALENRYRARKADVDKAYEAARAKGELEAPVDMQPFADLLQSIQSRTSTSPNVKAVTREAINQGHIKVDEGGNFVGVSKKINDVEELRKFINQETDAASASQVGNAAIMKGSLDEILEGEGGELYKRARELNRRLIREFEERVLIAKLLDTKPGSIDRKVALENVFKEAILRSSVAEMNTLRASLNKGEPGMKKGEMTPGRKAWLDLKAEGINYIKEKALGRSIDESGERIIKPAALAEVIESLDKSKKLQALYGKKEAQQLRDLAEIANIILTFPPGTVNWAGSGYAIINFLDKVASERLTGLPLPLRSLLQEAFSAAKDKKTRARIKDALKEPNE